MFNAAKAFNQNINSWQIESVKDMSYMFKENGVHQFQQDLSSWCVANTKGSSFGNTGGTNPSFGKASCFTTDATLRAAAALWTANPTEALAKHGKPQHWNLKFPLTGSMARLFKGATKLSGARRGEYTAGLSRWKVGAVTDMAGLFQGTTAFNADLNAWQMDNVTDTSDMFNYASSFDSPLNSWRTSAVTSMASMFKDARAFNADISGWDVTGVEDAQFMFSHASVFNRNIAAWRVRAATDLKFMFFEAAEFDQPLGAWAQCHVAKLFLNFAGSSGLAPANVPVFKFRSHRFASHAELKASVDLWATDAEKAKVCACCGQRAFSSCFSSGQSPFFL